MRHTVNSTNFDWIWYGGLYLRCYTNLFVYHRPAGADIIPWAHRVVVNADGVWLCLWTAATNGPIAHPRDDIWVFRVTVEWYWQGKIEELWENLVPVPLCPLQISHEVIRVRTPASAVRGWRLTAWIMAVQKGKYAAAMNSSILYLIHSSEVEWSIQT
jgi:hypothetical protein